MTFPIRKIAVFVGLILLIANISEGRIHEHRKMHSRQNFSRQTSQELRGSRDVETKLNLWADEAGLHRFQNVPELFRAQENGALVPLSDDATIQIDPRLHSWYRWCLPQTKSFLIGFAHEHFLLFNRPIQVNSAVRTRVYQIAMRRYNRNAAPVDGPTASLHMTGAAVDITKIGVSGRELLWMRSYLVAMERAGIIDATEEFHQAVFHIVVLR